MSWYDASCEHGGCLFGSDDDSSLEDGKGVEVESQAWVCYQLEKAMEEW